MHRFEGLDDTPAGWTGCVATIGVFDGVHRGHQHIVRTAVARARELGVPALVLTFEPQPEAVLRPGSEPPRLSTPRHKAELLADLGVDALCVEPFTKEFAALEPEPFVADALAGRLRARHVVVGANFRFGHRAAGDVARMERLGADHGITVEGCGLVGSGDLVWSSTYVRERVAVGDVAAAAEALGRPHRVEDVVIRGDGRGRALGYPTANLAAPSRFAVPEDGVYAGWLTLSPGPQAGERWPAAISVGSNPTFDGTSRRVEAYVLDREVDLYDRTVAVEFGERLRGMERFDSVPALVEQMGRDVERVRSVLG